MGRPATATDHAAPRVAPWRRRSTAAGGFAPRTARARRPSWWSTTGSAGSATRPGADSHADVVDAVVDLDGALVLPAFVDAHAHLSHTGMGLRGVDLAGTTSVSQALRAIEDAARRRGGRPVFALNWQEHDWAEDRRADRGRARPGQLRGRGLRVAHRRALRGGLQRPGDDAPAPTGSTAGRATGSSPATPRTPPGPPSTPPAAPSSAATTSRTPCAPRPAQGIAVVHECGGPLLTSAGDFADVLELGRRPRPPPHRRLLGRGGHRPRAGPGAGRRCTAPRASAGDLNIDGSIGSHTAHLRERLRRRPRLPRHGLPVQRRRARPRRGLRRRRHPERVPRHRRRRHGHRAGRATRPPPTRRARRRARHPTPARARRDGRRRRHRHGWRASAWSPACSRPSTRSGEVRPGCTRPASAATGCPARTRSRRWRPPGSASRSAPTHRSPPSTPGARSGPPSSTTRADAAARRRDRRRGAHRRRVRRGP